MNSTNSCWKQHQPECLHKTFFWSLASDCMRHILTADLIRSDITNADLPDVWRIDKNRLISFTKQKWEMPWFSSRVFGSQDSSKGKKKNLYRSCSFDGVCSCFHKQLSKACLCLKPWVITREINEPDSSCENGCVCLLVIMQILYVNQKCPNYLNIFILGSYTCKMYLEDMLMSCFLFIKTTW